MESYLADAFKFIPKHGRISKYRDVVITLRHLRNATFEEIVNFLEEKCSFTISVSAVCRYLKKHPPSKEELQSLRQLSKQVDSTGKTKIHDDGETKRDKPKSEKAQPEKRKGKKDIVFPDYESPEKTGAGQYVLRTGKKFNK